MCQTNARWFSGFAAISVYLLALGVQAVSASEHRRPAAIHGRQVTRASWYGNEFRGRQTADGSRFDPRRLTAAHPTLRLGSKVRVTELSSGKSVVVLINDRGPYIRGRGIDLSRAAARSLGMIDRGVARVAIEPLGKDARSDAVVRTVTAAADPTPWWMPKAIVQ